MVRCDTCGEDFSRNDALTRHKKYSCNDSHKTESKRKNVDFDANSRSVTILPHDNMSQDIPTFDGAEFSGVKPKSEETCKIMEMLKIPQEKRASILKEEKKLDELKAPSKEPPIKKMKIIPLLLKSDHSHQMPPEQLSEPEEVTSPPVVKAPHLDVGEKKCLNRFSQLFRETKQTGKDNSEQLCILLDRLENHGTLDETSCDKVYDAIVNASK